MKYLIGEMLADEVKKHGKPFRVYAIERDILEVNFNLMKNGKRVATIQNLKRLIDLELLRNPLKDEIERLLPTLDTETIIDVYNLIYRKVELEK